MDIFLLEQCRTIETVEVWASVNNEYSLARSNIQPILLSSIVFTQRYLDSQFYGLKCFLIAKGLQVQI